MTYWHRNRNVVGLVAEGVAWNEKLDLGAINYMYGFSNLVLDQFLLTIHHIKIARSRLDLLVHGMYDRKFTCSWKRYQVRYSKVLS